jgi:hypothetical protein
MARKIELIEKEILDNIAAEPTLAPILTSTSKRAIYRLYAFIISTAIGVLEQLIDIFEANVEATAAAASPASLAWIQKQAFLFQYSTDVPQIIQLINFAPSYPMVDATLRIISRASVTTDLSNSVIVKVATGEPPVALSTDQATALQSYINQVGAAGITYVVKSSNPDQLYLQASVYYRGLYSSVIRANVILAIDTYLSKLDFGGKLKIGDMEQAIRNVDGVTDIILENVQARADTMAFMTGTYLVLNNAIIARLWPTVSGYMISETTTGKTLADTLTFIPE